MKVESRAGNFVSSFERMEPGQGGLVSTGKMGVWQATTHMSFSEFLGILAMTLRPRIVVFLLRALVTGGRFAGRRGQE